MAKKTQVILSAVIALFVALLIGGYLANLEQKYKTGAKKVSVLIARGYIDQGTMIKPELLEEIKVPQEYVQPKAIQAFKEITGENGIPLYMAIVPILEGEQVLTTKLFGLGQETGLAAVVPTDKRAFSIACERSKIRGIIRPGNKVDVIAILDYYNEKGQKFEEARTILQNITVLSVGKQVLGVVKPGNSNKGGEVVSNDEDTETQITVSFSVTAEESQMLALASSKGNLVFSLRPTGDEKINTVSPLSISKLCNGSFVSAGKTPAQNITGSPVEMMKSFQKQQEQAVKLLEKYQKN